jgi:aminomuconate-semialdehyde/2-hydroxymuconate-6-semialdehyde dehydrogenase
VSGRLQLQNFIGGEFVSPAEGQSFTHLNPFTGEPACEVPDSDILDIVRAVQAANKAWTTWQKVEPAERAQYLKAIAKLIEKRSETLAVLQSHDDGSSVEALKAISFPRAAAVFNYYGSLNVQKPRLPVGVVSIITPWSDSFFALASRVAPALMAGNVVIAKPSEFAPETAAAFAQLIKDAGLPSGVFNLVQGRGVRAGRAIMDHPGLSLVSFMGSTDTGREIQKGAAELLKRTHLALGARNPVLIFNEVDLEKWIAAIVDLTMRFSGATCLRGSRIFVQDALYERFLERYKAEVEGRDFGPMINAESKKRFEAAVELAVQERGKLLFGGTGLPENLDPSLRGGFFVKPTAVYDLTLCSTLQQDEVVGPFVSISSFKYQHDAIKHANNSPLGQAAYIFHPDQEKALKIASKIEASRIFVNGDARSFWDPSVVFAGVKGSGLGREGGEESLAFFSRETLILDSLHSSAT